MTRRRLARTASAKRSTSTSVIGVDRAPVPVEIITSEGGTVTTITVVSVEQGALDAAEFEPPDGYQQMQIPIRR